MNEHQTRIERRHCGSSSSLRALQGFPTSSSSFEVIRWTPPQYTVLTWSGDKKLNSHARGTAQKIIAHVLLIDHAVTM
jgi:hypothetical protein